tara:strand:- start:1414 stop:1851 length:438 start_codon:yes stop_codon:yes gene_type:complete
LTLLYKPNEKTYGRLKTKWITPKQLFEKSTTQEQEQGARLYTFKTKREEGVMGRGRHKNKEPVGATKEIVNKLIALKSKGVLKWGSQLGLAQEYGVSRQYIHIIKNRWKKIIFNSEKRENGKLLEGLRPPSDRERVSYNTNKERV